MAAVVLASPPQREQFLLLLAPFIAVNLPPPTLRLSDVATGPMTNTVDNAILLTFGPLPPAPLPWPVQVPRAMPHQRLDFTGLVAEIGHPFNGPEMRTSVLEMFREAVRRINWVVAERLQGRMRLPRLAVALNDVYIRHRFVIRFSPGGNQGPISGIAEMAVMRNHQPICIIEVKRYEQDNAHFDHGRAQAFV